MKNPLTKKDETNKAVVRLDEKHIGWHGSVPFVEFDENFVQMSLTRTELKIPREHTTRMTYLSWWSGFIAGAMGQANLKKFLIFIIIMSFVTAGIVWFMGSQTQQSIAIVRQNITTMRADVLNSIYSIRNMNQSVPVV